MIYTDMTKRALNLCFEAHKEQRDKSGMPYVFHPFHLAEQMRDEDTTIVALLHDVIEDTSYTIADLAEMGFHERVCAAIELMTHDPQIPYPEYIERIKSNPIAKAVKLADLRHNSDMSRLDVITSKDAERVKKYFMAIEMLEKEELERLYGIKVLILQADISAGADNEKIVNEVVEKTLAEFGRIDVLINNAQASASGVALSDHTTDQFNLAMYSGLYATFYYMKACYPHLAKTQGSVINFASGAGLFGNYGQCAYAAAKEGIRGLSRVAATEWGKDNINVNIVCPLAWTAQLEQFQQAYPEAFEKNVKMPPIGHYGDAEAEIGRVCVQLAHPDFKFMTGETLTLEGGLGQRP